MRDHARERFANWWGLGMIAALLAVLLSAPLEVRIGVAAVWLAVAVHLGLAWLRLAIAGGELRRALPDYGWALLSLLLIAVGCAAVAAVVLLVAGEPLTSTTVGTGAFFGVVVVLAGWWLVRGRHRSEAP